MLTKLEAVNLMLDAISEAPVSSLDTGLVDAKKAERILDRVSKQVQESGWHCNTDYDMTFTPDTGGLIQVSDNILQIDTSSYDAPINVVPRPYNGKRCLYNVVKQTFVFANKLTCDVVYLFDFTDLTPPLQDYIAVKAAREFQDTEIGSTVIDKKLAERMAEAWQKLEDDEAETEDTNVFTDNPFLFAATYRVNCLFGK